MNNSWVRRKKTSENSTPSCSSSSSLWKALMNRICQNRRVNSIAMLKRRKNLRVYAVVRSNQTKTCWDRFPNLFSTFGLRRIKWISSTASSNKLRVNFKKSKKHWKTSIQFQKALPRNLIPKSTLRKRRCWQKRSSWKVN